MIIQYKVIHVMYWLLFSDFFLYNLSLLTCFVSRDSLIYLGNLKYDQVDPGCIPNYTYTVTSPSLPPHTPLCKKTKSKKLVN